MEEKFFSWLTSRYDKLVNQPLKKCIFTFLCHTILLYLIMHCQTWCRLKMPKIFLPNIGFKYFFCPPPSPGGGKVEEGVWFFPFFSLNLKILSKMTNYNLILKRKDKKLIFILYTWRGTKKFLVHFIKLLSQWMIKQ